MPTNGCRVIHTVYPGSIDLPGEPSTRLVLMDSLHQAWKMESWQSGIQQRSLPKQSERQWPYWVDVADTTNSAAEATIHKTKGHDGPVRGLDFNPIAKNLLASGATNGQASLYLSPLTLLPLTLFT